MENGDKAASGFVRVETTQRKFGILLFLELGVAVLSASDVIEHRNEYNNRVILTSSSNQNWKL